jgi:mannose-6-phosphate isomerase-like protein (cupin superfamily)
MPSRRKHAIVAFQIRGAPMLPFNQRIKKLAKANHDFRRVLVTTPRLQVVLMALSPGEEIGMETHEDTDQVFYIVKGEGRAVVGGESHAFKRGSMVVVPAGTPHNLINDAGEGLKLFTIYVPPHHRPSGCAIQCGACTSVGSR